MKSLRTLITALFAVATLARVSVDATHQHRHHVHRAEPGKSPASSTTCSTSDDEKLAEVRRALTAIDHYHSDPAWLLSPPNLAEMSRRAEELIVGSQQLLSQLHFVPTAAAAPDGERSREALRESVHELADETELLAGDAATYDAVPRLYVSSTLHGDSVEAITRLADTVGETVEALLALHASTPTHFVTLPELRGKETAIRVLRAKYLEHAADTLPEQAYLVGNELRKYVDIILYHLPRNTNIPAEVRAKHEARLREAVLHPLERKLHEWMVTIRTESQYKTERRGAEVGCKVERLLATAIDKAVERVERRERAREKRARGHP